MNKERDQGGLDDAKSLELAVLAVAGRVAFANAALAQQPVEIRMGVGTAAEEQAWLMKARPDLTPNQNKLYKYTMSMFRSGGERLTAFQAGQLDALTSSTTGRPVRGLEGRADRRAGEHGAREHQDLLDLLFRACRSRDVSLTNLKGKTIGINGYRTSIELYARIAVAKAGLDAERDVKWLIVPLPQMAEALRQKKIDHRRLPHDLRVSRDAGGRREEGVRLRRHQRHRGGVRRRFQPGTSSRSIREACAASLSDFVALYPLLRGEAGRGPQEPDRLQASSRPIRRSTSA